ncbi:Lysylphosphatidylglycerol synthase TM region [Klenkia marina]|uniref:Lysylphosphatidylglycerol synthase TM region n=1 Tax=Klenkia marina TaxID=1960309 RepID=A0A1G4XTZ1_9ACTN|nr:Lysylphosphatidylglycerol synthase TM region [Klenkia marina]
MVVAVAWTHREDLTGTTVHLSDPRWVLVLAAALLLWWSGWVALHAGALAAVTRVRAADLPEVARGAVAAVALNSVVTSAGLAGLTAMARAGRRRGMARAEVASGYLLAATVTDLGFLLVMVAGFGVLGAHHQLTALDLLAGVLFLALCAARVALTVLAVRRPAALHRLAGWALRVRARVLRRPVEQPDPERAQELVRAAELVTRRPARALPPLLAATVVDVAGVLMLWAALAAVGGGADLGLALSAYVLASVAAILGPVPGGVGAAEVGAAAALTVGGVPLGVAAAATLLFRVAEFWVPLAVGGLAWITARAEVAA